jgi:translation initiation factor 3 subunit D
VFSTDSIISTLMCCSRSVYPWDILVSKVDGKIFLDKRDDSNFDLLTVSETSTEPPQDDDKHINSPHNLALEATYINHNLSQQLLHRNDERIVFPDQNPFIEKNMEGEIASVAYRYRKWDLGDNINLIIRSEIDAVQKGANDEKLYLNIKALNEWETKPNMDWRSKLDAQPGAVLASEIKNNGCKLAKWTVSSILSGVDQIKFGFVTRVNMRATDKHIILGMQQFKPYEFASQIALNMDNSWGVVRCIIDFIMKHEDGKYLIMKDPNKVNFCSIYQK